MSITFAPQVRTVTAAFPDGLYETPAGAPDMNVANANGWALLTALGIEPEYCGGLPVADFKGRVLAALALPEGEFLDLPTDPASQALLDALGADTEGGPTVVVGTRHEGYVAERLATLLAICAWAEEHHADEVGWS